MLRRVAVIAAAVVLCLAILIVGALAWITFYPGVLKGPIERIASDRVGMPVRIEGPIALDLGKVVQLEAQNIRVEAPGWASAPDLLSLARLKVGFDLLAYLRDRTIHLTRIDLDRPQLLLERDAQGRTTWPESLGAGKDQTGQDNSPTPQIDALTIEDGKVTYRDPAVPVDMTAGISTTAPAGAENFARLEVKGGGKLRGHEVDLALVVGSPLMLGRPDQPFPIKGHLDVPGAQVELEGNAQKPLALDGVTLALQIAAKDPDQLMALLGRNSTAAPQPLSAEMTVTRDAGVVAVEKLKATYGDSALTGSLRYDPTAARPRIEGQLDASMLDVPALQALAGEPIEPAAEPSTKSPPSPSALASLDGRIAIHVAQARLPKGTAHDIAATLTLEEGRLTVDPLKLAVGPGALSGSIVTGPLDQPLEAKVVLDARSVDIGALMPKDTPIGGILTAKLSATLRGTDLEAIARQSTAQVQGQVEKLHLPSLADRLPQLSFNAELADKGERPLTISAKGTLGGTPLQLDAHGGEPSLLLRQEAYPLSVALTLGETKASAEGSLGWPLSAGQADLALSIEGPDPGPVMALFDLPAINLPPYRLDGHLKRQGAAWRFQKLDGKVGDSDVAGEMALDLGGARPKLTGNLLSHHLDLDDLGGLVGAEPSTAPGETASAHQKDEARKDAGKQEVIPDKKLDPARWRRLDADVKLTAEKVVAGRLPFDGFDLEVVLDDGRLRVDPVKLQMGRGTVEGHVGLDTRKTPAAADLDLTASQLPVGEMLKRLNIGMGKVATLSGRARGGMDITGHGLSLKDILAGGNGELTLVMVGGSIDRRIVEALGFDLLGMLGSLIGGAPAELDLNCTLADLALKNGVLTTQSLVIDTDPADIGGQGTIDLGTEKIDIALIARSKGSPLPSGRTGIKVTGTLAKPEIGLETGTLLARGAAAATFGVLLRPFTALGSMIAGPAKSDDACSDVVKNGNAG